MTSLRSKHRANLCCGIFFLVLAAVVALYSKTIPVCTLNMGIMNSQSFPLICSAVLALLSICLVWQSVRGMKQAPKPTEEELAAERAERVKPLRALCAVILVGTYIQFLKPVGYLIMTPLFLFGLVMLVTPKSVRRPVRIAVISIVVSAIIYLTFRYGFAVQLPMGLLKNLG